MITGMFGWLKSQLQATDTNAEFAETIRRSLPNYNTVFIVREQTSRGFAENIVSMDVELRGKMTPSDSKAELLGMPDDGEESLRQTFLSAGDEKGDVPQKAIKEGEQKKKKAPIEKSLYRKKSPSNTEMTRTEKLIHQKEAEKREKEELLKNEPYAYPDTMELIDVPMPFRMVELRSSHQDLNNLLQHCPEPQPPLTHKHLKTLQLNADQASIIADQVGKMKTGLARLQEIVQKFDCANKFKNDIDFLVENVGPAIAASEAARRAETGSAEKKE